MRGGLATLQKLALVAAALVASGDSELSLAVRARLHKQAQSCGLVHVAEVLAERAERLSPAADADPESAAALERATLETLLDKLEAEAGLGVGLAAEGE
jgi:hypothetical protein